MLTWFVPGLGWSESPCVANTGLEVCACVRVNVHVGVVLRVFGCV